MRIYSNSPVDLFENLYESDSQTVTVGDIVRMTPGEEHNLEGLGEADCDLMVIKSKLV